MNITRSELCSLNDWRNLTTKRNRKHEKESDTERKSMKESATTTGKQIKMERDKNRARERLRHVGERENMTRKRIKETAKEKERK